MDDHLGARDQELEAALTEREMLRTARGLREVRRCLKDGADARARFEYGRTPLMLACMKGWTAAAKELLASGADPGAVDEAERDALHYAVSCGKDAGDADFGLPCLRLLLEAGASIHASASAASWEGEAKPIHMACAHGAKAIAELLLAKGASIQEIYGSGRFTPLHLAVLNGRAEVTAMLVSKGADLKAKDAKGFTPMELAVSEQHAECAAVIGSAIEAAALKRSVKRPHAKPSPGGLRI